MLPHGVYPASVTPMTPGGQVDHAGLVRLLAHFESHGCQGAVLAGTNGEGPSLGAVEKRDLIRTGMTFARSGIRPFHIVLGIATSSLDEAIWSSNQAFKAGASAGLVMAPSYFREASEEGIAQWFEALFDATELPILVYNFPQRTGVTISPALMERLGKHPRMLGAKDSSGERTNLEGYASAVPGKQLFVGNETLLLDALKAGWSGTISGAANVLANWLSAIVADYETGDFESAEAKFRLTVVGIEAIRKSPQPGANKALLAQLGILPTPALRLPLLPPDPSLIEATKAGLEGLVTF